MFVRSGRGPKRGVAVAACLLFAFGMFVNIAKPANAEKLLERSMYINSARASDTTFYDISFKYATVASVGSVQFEFCTTPIYSLPCDGPAGQDVSGAVLSSQTGNTGFSISMQTNNVIVLSRTAAATNNAASTYRLDNAVNPDGTGSNAYFSEPPDEKTVFYVRITTYASTDATGPLIDFGSVTSIITPELELFTQVPPILIFCVAGLINDDECADTSGNFVNFGEFDPTQTYYTSSEMLARTNAQFGYNIFATGGTMSAGIHTIANLTTPTESFVATPQFGINLATNNTPPIGAPPVGPGTNAVISPNYDQDDLFTYNNGDVLVSSSGVTPTRKFTVSYMVNLPADQAPGVYSTTISYICLAGF